jgi:hypothetical protein
MIREAWDYDRRKWKDRKDSRWHFALHVEWSGEATWWSEERAAKRSFTLYFRNDSRTIFGVIPDSVQRGYWDEKLKEKIMNDPEFRHAFIKPETKRIWKKSWK